MGALRIRIGNADEPVLILAGPGGPVDLRREYVDAHSYDDLHGQVAAAHRLLAHGCNIAARALLGCVLAETSPAPTDALAGERDSVPSQSGTGGDQCPTCGGTGRVENGLGKKRCYTCSGRPTETSKPCSHLWHEYDENCAGCNPAHMTSPAPVGENDVARTGGDVDDHAVKAPSPSTAGAGSDESAPAGVPDRRCGCSKDVTAVECPYHGSGI